MTTSEPIAVSTILLADDDPDLVSLSEHRLTRAGYHVITACDGEQALRMAEQFLPDVAVLDVMMPKLSGIRVMALLARGAATRQIRIILISAQSRDSIRGRVVFVDRGEYITKPFGRWELQNRVRTVLAS